MITESELKHKLARFGEHELDCSSGRLTTNGQDVNLEPLVFQFLLILIQHHGDVVSKKAVLDSLWPNKTPTDEALRAMVKKAREVLKDNARNPSYIKTIPTKGYMLIPNVVLTSTIVKTWFQHNKKIILIASLVVTVLLMLLFFWYTYNNAEENNANKIAIAKTELTQFPAVDVSAHYIGESLFNISMVFDFTRSRTTIIWDDFASKKQVRVTLNVLLNRDFWWSDKHKSLLVTRSDGLAFYVLETDFEDSESSIIDYVFQEKLEHQILGFGGNTNLLYVFNKDAQQIQIVNLNDASQATFLSLNGFTAAPNELTDIVLYPHPEDRSFILALTGTDTFALYRIEAPLTSETSGEAQIQEITNRPGKLQSAVWNKQGSRFSFSDEQGQVFSFQVETKRLTSWNTGGEPIYTLVADCGDTCFITSDTQGLSKLVETSNPFYAQNNLGFTTLSNSNTNIESTPNLSEGGLYFVSETVENTRLMFVNNDNSLSEIYRFDKQSIIDEFIVNESADMVVGLLNQRPFMFNLATEELEFLNIAFPKLSHLRFNLYGNIEFYAEPSNDPSGLYEYNVSNKQISLKHKGMLQVIPLVLSETTEGGKVRHKANLMIGENKQAKVVFQNNKETVNIDLLNSVCAACFQIQGNYLYSSSLTASSKLSRIDLLSGEIESRTLYIDELRPRFALSENGQKLVLTSRQNLRTKLIQLEGLVQVY